MTEAEKGLPPEHVHDVSCAFGSPTCPAFAEPAPPPRRRWWHRVFPPAKGDADA